MQFLTDHERAQLKAQHRQERDGKARDRIKAILLYDKDWSPQQIAEALLISDQAIRNHVDDYKTSKKLHPESGGSEEKLSKKQSELIETHLRQHTSTFMSKISQRTYRRISASPTLFMDSDIGYNDMGFPTKNLQSCQAKPIRKCNKNG